MIQLRATGEASLDSGSATYREGDVKSVKLFGIQCFVCGRYMVIKPLTAESNPNCFKCGKAGHEARNAGAIPKLEILH